MKGLAFGVAILMLGACATTSGVMEAEDGTFLISASAAPPGWLRRRYRCCV